MSFWLIEKPDDLDTSIPTILPEKLFLLSKWMLTFDLALLVREVTDSERVRVILPPSAKAFPTLVKERSTKPAMAMKNIEDPGSDNAFSRGITPRSPVN